MKDSKEANEGAAAKRSVHELPPSAGIINFFFELGMLKKTPRSGYQFLGSGRESVAEHSYRVAMIGYTMARMAEHPDPFRVVLLCLFHDVPESRTGDLNYVNKHYVKPDEKAAIDDLAATLPFGNDYKGLMEEYRTGDTSASKLVHDADQIDLILELKEQSDLGNRYAMDWICFALQRLQTEIGKKLADEILHTDSKTWWFEGHDHWWQKNHEE